MEGYEQEVNTAPESVSQDYSADAPGSASDAGSAPDGTDTQAQGAGPKGQPNEQHAERRRAYELQRVREELAAERAKREAYEQFMYTQQQQPAARQTDPNADFRNRIMSMSEEELSDAFAESPKAVMAAFLQQGFSEADQRWQQRFEQFEHTQTAAQMEAVERKQFEGFVAENPEFVSLFQEGAVEQYMRQYPNSTYREAYFALTRDTQLQQAASQGRNQALAARAGKAQLPPQGGRMAAAPLGSDIDPRLKDSSKHGGKTDALRSWFRDYKAGKVAAVG